MIIGTIDLGYFLASSLLIINSSHFLGQMIPDPAIPTFMGGCREQVDAASKFIYVDRFLYINICKYITKIES